GEKVRKRETGDASTCGHALRTARFECLSPERNEEGQSLAIEHLHVTQTMVSSFITIAEFPATKNIKILAAVRAAARGPSFCGHGGIFAMPWRSLRDLMCVGLSGEDLKPS